MTTPRQGILDNLATTFAGITTLGGYKTNVTTVERTVKTWDEIGTEQFPWVGFMPQRETKEYEPGNMIMCTLPVYVIGHLSSSSRTADAANFLDDLIASLASDTTRGANAIMTTIRDAGSDESDPNFLNSKGGELSIDAVVEIRYQRSTASS